MAAHVFALVYNMFGEAEFWICDAQLKIEFDQLNSYINPSYGFEI